MKFIPNFLLNILAVAATVLLFHKLGPLLGFTWQEMCLIAVMVMMMTIIDRLIWVKVVLTAIGDRLAQYEKPPTVIGFTNRPRNPYIHPFSRRDHS